MKRHIQKTIFLSSLFALLLFFLRRKIKRMLIGKLPDRFFSWWSYGKYSHFSEDGYGDITNALRFIHQVSRQLKTLSDSPLLLKGEGQEICEKEKICDEKGRDGEKKICVEKGRDELEEIGEEVEIKMTWQSPFTQIPSSSLSSSSSSSSSASIKREIVKCDGWFESPASPFLPSSCKIAHFRIVLPQLLSSSSSENDKVLQAAVEKNVPMVLILAASGQEGYDSRLFPLSYPLASEHGVGTILLENPMYGSRRIPKPPGHPHHCTCSVAELVLKGGASIVDGRHLVLWLHQLGFTRLGIGGLSMGAEMSTIVGASLPFPVAIAPLLPVHTASEVWTVGVMSSRCNWEKLATQQSSIMQILSSFSSSSLSSVVSPSDSSHLTQEDRINLAKSIVANILDHATDIRSLPPPRCPQAAVIIGARDDQYVPSSSVSKLHGHWPGSTLRWVDGGHVWAFVAHSHTFVHSILDSLELLDKERGRGE